ncbi:MAG: GNAT family N-acetyltransferase [Pseudomonadota bacterium]|jgi:predicted N-acyltransferase|nr:GNAT family N-acetyltransferase [Pseudomonadota bacterium]
MKIEFVESIKKINEEVWNDLIKSSYPFLQYSFLLVLENSKCVGENTGWYPFYLLVKEEKKIIGIMPMYIKTDSHGEFIFDWSWADAFYRNGLDYYPKLLSAIPFTPATGPRLCLDDETKREEISILVQNGIEQISNELGISSAHILFPERTEIDPYLNSGFSLRTSYSFHWFNNNYKSFEDFLSELTSRQRKNIKKERSKITNQEISLERLAGEEITEETWISFYHFYQLTYLKRGMQAYLNLDFFLELCSLMPESIVLVLAKNLSNKEYVAGALNFQDSNNLYGRYWGCLEEFDSLHFETCYYQGIEYCIENKLKRFDPGVQGEHKIKRGFLPIETYSVHWVKDLRFKKAIDNFLTREREQILNYKSRCRSLIPFKRTVIEEIYKNESRYKR